VQSEESPKEKPIDQFDALMLKSYIHKKMKKHTLHKN